jgi:RND family efflux transporter MFP subunit
VADYKIRKLTFERMANVWKETPDVIAKQDVDVAEAAFQGAKHAMEQREALRSYTKLTAPYDGVITARFADPGALIQVATNSATSAIPLFTIMALETVRVYASVPQEDTPWVRPGIPARLQIKEFTGPPMTGTVTRTTESLDPATRSLLVEVDLPNADHRLQPGTFGELTLTLKVSPQALVIPPSAITVSAGVNSVFVIQNGRAHVQTVKTGLSDGRWTEILEGLAGDEQIVVAGKSKLNEGAPVVVSPYQLPEGTPSIQKFPTQRPNS